MFLPARLWNSPCRHVALQTPQLRHDFKPEIAAFAQPDHDEASGWSKNQPTQVVHIYLLCTLCSYFDVL